METIDTHGKKVLYGIVEVPKENPFGLAMVDTRMQLVIDDREYHQIEDCVYLDVASGDVVEVVFSEKA